MEIAKLPEGFNWDNAYTIESSIGQGSMAYIYRAKVDLQKFDFANLISYWEAQKENVAPENVKAYCNYRKDIWSSQETEELMNHCRKNNICYPEQGVCALKILKPTEHIERFFTEWQNTVGIYDPHLLQVYGGGIFEENCYYAMEFIAEPYSLLKLYDLPLEDKVTLILQAAKGLDSLHKMNIVHRDVKIDNFIIFDNNGQLHLKIADLGIAKDFDSNQTKTNQILGTPNFMSPEQVKNSKHVSFLSDIYSLGATFYELVCKQPPYHKQSLQGILYNINQSIPPTQVTKISEEVPEEVENIIERMMAFNTTKRIATMVDVQNVLKEYQAGTYKVEKSTRKRSKTTKAVAIPKRKKRTESYKKTAVDQQKTQREMLLKVVAIFIGPLLLVLYLLFAESITGKSKENDNRGLPMVEVIDTSSSTHHEQNNVNENKDKNKNNNANLPVYKKDKLDLLSNIQGSGEWRNKDGDDWLGLCANTAESNIDSYGILEFEDISDWPEYEISFDVKVTSGTFSFGIRGLSENNIVINLMQKLDLDSFPNIWFHIKVLVTQDKISIEAEESKYRNVISSNISKKTFEATTSTQTVWKKGIVGFIVASDGIFPGYVHLSKINFFGLEKTP